MNLTDQQKARMEKFQTSDVYGILREIIQDIVKRSWKMRKSGTTNDETLRNVYTGEGMEAGAMEVLNIINKIYK